MNAPIEIQLRMEKIKEIFLSAQTVAAKEVDFDLLSEQLNKTENEFRSVAYEAASMEIALKDFTINNSLENWKLFAAKFQQHGSQIHVGLGWAIAQQRIPVLPFIDMVNAELIIRVLDGIGYYNGIFRPRNTVLNKNIPDEIAGNLFFGFDQGVGRSLWYSAEGNVPIIAARVNEFALSRQKDLWRGIAIACVYVGGINKAFLNTVSDYANKYLSDLAIGCAMVAQARVKAGALTSDIELACKTWCNCTAKNAALVADLLELEVLNSLTSSNK